MPRKHRHSKKNTLRPQCFHYEHSVDEIHRLLTPIFESSASIHKIPVECKNYFFICLYHLVLLILLVL